MVEGAVHRFVGIGVNRYEQHDLEDLTYPVAEVRALSERWMDDFAGELLCDPDEVEVRTALKAVAARRADAVVLVWSGHGSMEPNRFTLHTRDSDGEVTAADIVHYCAKSGAAQLFFVIDACSAGAAIMDATSVASAWVEQFPPDSDRVWFGILVSCGSAEQARDGLFGSALLRMLESGPKSPNMRRRWSVHNRLISGDDLGQAVLEDWANEDIDGHQRPDFLQRGRGRSMFPNPLWDRGAGAQVVEHLLRAARSGREERSWFTGRAREVDTVVGWIDSATAGMWVVTGSAGTGKSAILGRVVSMSDPVERANLGDSTGWGHADPGQGSVQAHARARGTTVDRLSQELDGLLVGAGVLEGAEQRRNAAELVGALQRRAERSGTTTPVVLIDGLDEAHEEAFAIAQDLLCRMARFATIIVSTRSLKSEVTPHELIGLMSAIGVLDLDAPASRVSQSEAMNAYIMRRLEGVSPSMEASLIAHQTLAAGAVSTSFLLARIITDQLRAHPIDTGLVGWEQRLASSLGQAFDTDLEFITEPAMADIGVGPALLAKTLLTALTWGLGAGFPEPEWIAVATVLTGVQIDFEHVSWVLDELGRYVVQDGEAGVAVYRLAHQSIADYLRPPYRPSQADVFDPAATAVTSALLLRYRELLTEGYSAGAPTYLWRYAFRHAAAAGPAGVDEFRELTNAYAALVPDLPRAELACAAALGQWGHRREALEATEKAVMIARELAADDAAYLPDLAGALNNLGIRYTEVGRHHEALAPTEEAVALRRAMAADNTAYLPDLAAALNNLGVRYSGSGRRKEAVAPAEKAVTVYQRLVADNAAYLPDLAGALNNVGYFYSGLGRLGDAVEPTEEAVRVYRDLAAENPTFLPDLAMSLDNLGVRYSDLGRRRDALAPAEEAVALYRELATNNPAFLPNLAQSKSNLGIRYSEVGRPGDAVVPSEEAVMTYRPLATDNPAFLPDLAVSLSNLGIRYRAVGRRREALMCSEEAVALYRELATDNSKFLSNLATSLSDLGIRYAELGRFREGLVSAEEAVAIYRPLAADDRFFSTGLAMSLTNLGVLYSRSGHPGAAVEPTEEAVIIYRDMAAENPAYLPKLAGALSNLGIRYGGVGRYQEGLVSAEEAVTVYRPLAAADHAFLPDFAKSLTNLAARYSKGGRHDDALEATEEAVTLRRNLAADNPAYLPNLAMSLTNLGVCYSEVGRRQEALGPSEEAVALYRDLAADNPAFRLYFAVSLSNLAARYSEVGRHDEAVEPTEDAVGLYRVLAADSPAHLQDLADALTSLERARVRVDRGGEVDAIWRAAIASQPESGRAHLWAARAQALPDGDLRAVAWLISATDVARDRHVLSTVHDCARRHRDVNPELWDRAWSDTSSGPLPPWLTVDPGMLATARGWVTAGAYDDECAYLQNHPILLEPTSDTAIAEALITTDDADRYRRIRRIAREQGVHNAYRPLFHAAVLDQFVAADLRQQRWALEHHADLLTPENTREHLRELIDADPDDPQPRRAAAMIALFAADRAVLDDSIDALEAPARFLELMAATARMADAITLLGPVAELAASAASDAAETADALMYRACANAIAGGEDAMATADSHIRQAISFAPRRRTQWIIEIADLGRVHPAALSLVPFLAKGTSDVTD